MVIVVNGIQVFVVCPILLCYHASNNQQTSINDLDRKAVIGNTRCLLFFSGKKTRMIADRLPAKFVHYGVNLPQANGPCIHF